MWYNKNKRTKQALLNIVTARNCSESQCVAGAAGTAGRVGDGGGEGGWVGEALQWFKV